MEDVSHACDGTSYSYLIKNSVFLNHISITSSNCKLFLVFGRYNLLGLQLRTSSKFPVKNNKPIKACVQVLSYIKRTRNIPMSHLKMSKYLEKSLNLIVKTVCTVFTFDRSILRKKI